MGEDHKPAAEGGDHKEEAKKDFIPATGYTTAGERVGR